MFSKIHVHKLIRIVILYISLLLLVLRIVTLWFIPSMPCVFILSSLIHRMPRDRNFRHRNKASYPEFTKCRKANLNRSLKIVNHSTPVH